MLEGALTQADVGALPGVAEVSATGAGYTARLDGTATGQDALKAAFARDLDIRRFEVREPTLHDAFIVLTGDQA
jgi:ABC-2 type transport system ATP-binding protein